MTEEKGSQDEQTFEDIEKEPESPEEPNFDNQYREETAAEYMPNPGLAGGRSQVELSSDRTREQDEEAQSAGKGMGALGIAFSILSLFILPILFALAGIVFGVLSARKGRQALGYTAVAISAFSLIMSFFFAPFVL
ncbi:hypothetical protein [Salipaludibacillus daqingensis]|uniref:hypothetical protein n=1 Tax=Salipaludibacillus daqingensis TaxID=3041001 RepID=UPI0024745CC2|nr:hypothetical protein [Salipaludibacillus daqingensis]